MDRVLQDSSLYLLGNVASRVIGFLAIPFYARFLTPAQYGLIELIELSTQTIAIAFGLQAIGTALSRLFHDQTTPEGEQAVVSTSLIVTLGLSAFVTVVACAGARPLSLAVFHTDQWTDLLRAAFIAMFFSNMIEVVLVYERIRNNAKFYLVYTLLTLGAQLGLNILFIGVLGAGVWGFVSSKLVVTIVSSLYLAFRMKRDVGWHWRSMYVSELVRFGAPLILSSLSYFAIHFSDRFFLSSSVSLADLGRYALAYRFAILVSALVGDSFSKSWSVTLYRYVERSDWREQFARVASYLTFILYTTALGIALFSPELLRIMVPADFFPPPLLLPIIIASYLAREIGDFFRTLLLINKRSGLVGRIALASACVNLAANMALIPTYGIHGAAVATLVTWFIYMVVCWVIANKEHRLPVSIPAYLRITALLLAIYALAAATRGTSFTIQVILDGVWVLLFCVLALRWFFTAAERRGALGLVGSVALWGISLGARAPEPGASGPRRLLMLAYYYPPLNVIGAARPHRLATYLRREGVTVDVITSAAPAAGMEDEASVQRISAARPASDERAGWPVHRVSTVIHSLERLLLPYDDRLGWFPHAYAASTRLLTPGTVVFSTHPPTVTHMVALALKNRHGAPWIADFRDPLWGNPYRTAQRAALMDPVLERLTVENADAVIANTDASATLLRNRYPDLQHKVHVIWNGFDPEDGLRPGPAPVGARRIIAHVGTLYGNRTPLPFLTSLERLIARGEIDPETIQFHQVGRADPSCIDAAVPVTDTLIRLGCCHIVNHNVPVQEARQAMLGAEWLLLLDMNVVNPGLQVPAKLYEYVRTGRPILALTPPGSSTERVLAIAGVTHACVDLGADPDEFDAAVLDFLRRPTGQSTPSATFRAEFEAPYQAQRLLAIVDAVHAYGPQLHS